MVDIQAHRTRLRVARGAVALARDDFARPGRRGKKSRMRRHRRRPGYLRPDLARSLQDGRDERRPFERRRAREARLRRSIPRSSFSTSRSTVPTRSTASASCGRRVLPARCSSSAARTRSFLRTSRRSASGTGLKMLDPLQKPFRSEHLRRLFNGDHELRPRPPTAAGGARSRVAGRCGDRGAGAATIDLGEALAEHWLDMRYQPKVDLARSRVVGAEGLARINHPVHGILGPTSFLPGRFRGGASTPDRVRHQEGLPRLGGDAQRRAEPASRR